MLVYRDGHGLMVTCGAEQAIEMIELRTPGNCGKGLIPKIGFLSGCLLAKFVRVVPGLPYIFYFCPGPPIRVFFRPELSGLPISGYLGWIAETAFLLGFVRKFARHRLWVFKHSSNIQVGVVRRLTWWTTNPAITWSRVYFKSGLFLHWPRNKNFLLVVTGNDPGPGCPSPYILYQSPFQITPLMRMQSW